MTTNVRPEQLSYHNHPDLYDRDILAAIPGYKEVHDKMVAAAVNEFRSRPYSGNPNPIRILELGVGTGLTAERLLSVLPKAHLTGIDFSRAMLDKAVQRLEKYDAKLILGDYADCPFEEVGMHEGYDLVVAAFGIHHQTNEGKRQLFEKIYDSMKYEGIFLFADLVTYRNQQETALNDARHYAHMVNNAPDEATLRDWAHHHKFLNLPAPLEDQMEWLQKTRQEKGGFKPVKVLFQKYNTALISARKHHVLSCP